MQKKSKIEKIFKIVFSLIYLNNIFILSFSIFIFTILFQKKILTIYQSKLDYKF